MSKTTIEQFEELGNAWGELKKEFKIALKPIFIPIAKFFEKFEWLYWIIVFDILFIICVDIYITIIIN